MCAARPASPLPPLLVGLVGSAVQEPDCCLAAMVGLGGVGGGCGGGSGGGGGEPGFGRQQLAVVNQKLAGAGGNQ